VSYGGVRGLVVVIGVCVCSVVTSGSIRGAKSGFGIKKLGVACVYSCPNMLVIVCYGIPKV
jgi:hypothetical protein